MSYYFADLEMSYLGQARVGCTILHLPNSGGRAMCFFPETESDLGQAPHATAGSCHRPSLFDSGIGLHSPVILTRRIEMIDLKSLSSSVVASQHA